MPKKRRGKQSPRETNSKDGPSVLRVIGGKFRASRLEYNGDPGTRPMKDRVREAMFNLVGVRAAGKHVIDLFAGTGAIAIEAISRGADSAIMIERNFRTAEVIRRNVAHLNLEDRTTVHASDTFFWKAKEPELPTLPWLVFCSPPYDFYINRAEDMLELIAGFVEDSPAGSLVVVESDERFDTTQLPGEPWDTRVYAPAVVSVWEAPEDEEDSTALNQAEADE